MEHYRSVLPYFINDEPARLTDVNGCSHKLIARSSTIRPSAFLCAACTTSCPSYWANGKYVGPAAIVNAHRFIFDSRDEAAESRLNVVGDTFGVWRCRTIFNCTNACPREIEVTKAIAEVKVALATGKV